MVPSLWVVSFVAFVQVSVVKLVGLVCGEAYSTM